ncbi:MAG TPA: hypothetical protein VKZ57_02660 [Sphingobacterium sp.]|nr:hypothetical protein [Sphingobacterium sp.]
MKHLSQNQIASIFALSPFELDTMTNSLGQKVRFLEHPTQGDSYPVLIHIHEEGTDHVCISEFFETYDMTEIDDYTPLLVNGKIVMAFEAEQNTQHT